MSVPSPPPSGFEHLPGGRGLVEAPLVVDEHHGVDEHRGPRPKALAATICKVSGIRSLKK
ncbi:MAG TPA: hypothetical protein VF588_18620 [Pyrinomonadaceae bacterium]